MAFACQKCPYTVAVQPGERPPVWCPRCGSDLKAIVPANEAKPVRISAVDVSPVNASDSAAVEPKPLRIPEEDGSERAPLLPTPVPSAVGEDAALDTSGEVFGASLLWLAIG